MMLLAFPDKLHAIVHLALRPGTSSSGCSQCLAGTYAAVGTGTTTTCSPCPTGTTTTGASLGVGAMADL